MTETSVLRTPDPLVSICMPAYNVGTSLREALTSVLAQAYPAIEVVRVDDGSADETPQIARRFRAERLRRPVLSKIKLLVLRALLSMGVGVRSALWPTKALYRLAYRKRFVPSPPATPLLSARGSRS